MGGFGGQSDVTCLDRCRVWTRWGKPNEKVEKQTEERTSAYRETVGLLVSLLIHVSPSTWFDMSDAASWEMLIFHWVCVVFNGVFCRYVKVQWFPEHGRIL
jgi:hypothetical protein